LTTPAAETPQGQDQAGSAAAGSAAAGSAAAGSAAAGSAAAGSAAAGSAAAGGAAEEPSVFRVGGVTYLRIPTRDAGRSASFYKAVFGWRIKGDPDNPGFSDATGHVIGHWQADLPVAGEAGVIPYIFVDRVDDTLWQINSRGGEVVKTPYPEGDLWVATFRDPDGNVLGVWQHGPRQ
jgi:uncharacterized protein